MEQIDRRARQIGPLLYFRFIDDLLMVWDRRQGNVERLQELNQVDPNIRLTFITSETQNTFLDVELMKKERFAADGKLDWKVYFKPTDTHQLLHRTSCHPTHTFKGGITSQIIRYKSLCSQVTDFNTACEVLFKVMVKRGYTKRELLKIKDQVNKRPNRVLARNTEPKEQSLFLIMKWHPTLVKIPNWVRENWEKFWNHSEFVQKRVPKNIITSWKRAPNLRQKLVRAAIRKD
jgi:hypothetical protein